MSRTVAELRDLDRELGRDDEQLRGEDGHVGTLEPASTIDCYHGSVTFPTDPDVDFLVLCEQDAVFRVPMRGVVGTVALCPYHLARYLDAYDDLGHELVARGARQHAADPAFVSIDDAPDDVEVLEASWTLAAIDQRGLAHYTRPGEDRVVELRPTFDVKRLHRLESGTIADHMESIRETRGWAAFAPDLDLPLEVPP